jgi:hypothetical protein
VHPDSELALRARVRDGCREPASDDPCWAHELLDEHVRQVCECIVDRRLAQGSGEELERRWGPVAERLVRLLLTGASGQRERERERERERAASADLAWAVQAVVLAAGTLERLLDRDDPVADAQADLGRVLYALAVIWTLVLLHTLARALVCRRRTRRRQEHAAAERMRRPRARAAADERRRRLSVAARNRDEAA